MKKHFLTILSILILSNCFAQKDSIAIINKINKLESKIDNIEIFIKKMDSTEQKNKELQLINSKLNKMYYDLNLEKISVEENLLHARDSVKAFKQNDEIVLQNKSHIEKIINSLLNEHSSFNPEIIKALEGANKNSPFSNNNILITFSKLNRSIDSIKSFLSQPYDSLENKSHLYKLRELKKDAIIFKNLDSDIDKYIKLFSNYCVVTYTVGTAIASTSGNEAVREPKLKLLKSSFKDYDYLITELNKGIEKVNYKYIFKASCTD